MGGMLRHKLDALGGNFFRLTLFVACLFLSMDQVFAASDPLTLSEYLTDVKANHRGLQSSMMTAEASSQRLDEGNRFYIPKLNAQIVYSDDKSPNVSTTFQGNQTLATKYSLGVLEVTPFGLSADLSYNLTQIDVRGASSLFLPDPKYMSASPLLSLKQPLWRNGFGHEYQASVAMTNAQARTAHYGAQFAAKLKIAEAELTYWKLALAIETEKYELESEARAQQLRDWTKKQVDFNLSNTSNYLQAEAALKAKRYDGQRARDRLRKAAIDFNSLRGRSTHTVEQPLEKATPEAVAALEVPERGQAREDFLAAQGHRDVAQASATLAEERNKPDLSLIASYGLNGLNKDSAQARQDALSTKYREFMIGAQLQLPLDVFSGFRLERAYEKEFLAAEHQVERKRFEQDVDWENLLADFGEAKKRLVLALDLEKVQAQKFLNEKKMHERGRTTTYQVLIFEQDYLRSQLLVLDSVAEVLGIRTQMKTFQGDFAQGVDR